MLFPNTTSVKRYFPPAGAQRRVHGTTFPVEFCDTYSSLYYLYIKHNHIQAKTYKKYCFKTAAKLPIFILRHFDFGEIWKTISPKESFNEIWLIKGDYKYTNPSSPRKGCNNPRVQSTLTPVGAQGEGVPRDPTVESNFPTELCNEMCTIYVNFIKTHNSAKKYKINK